MNFKWSKKNYEYTYSVYYDNQWFSICSFREIINPVVENPSLGDHYFWLPHNVSKVPVTGKSVKEVKLMVQSWYINFFMAVGNDLLNNTIYKPEKIKQ